MVPTKTSKYRNKSVFLSTVTDPYLPLERKYQLTRRILEKLIPLQPNLGIQTKSDLVLRDIDLLKQFKNCEVGFTITTLNDELRREIEPFGSSVQNRINALKKLNEAGINTYVFIGPILPFLIDYQKIILATKGFVDMYMFENLNIKGTVWDSVRKWLKEKHPDLLERYERIYFRKNDYWESIERGITRFCKKEGLDFKVYFHHSK